MKEWWHNLQQREQRILIGGAAALVLVMFYALVWDPYQRELQELDELAVIKQLDLQEMQKAATTIASLRGSGGGGNMPAGQSIMGVVDSSAKQFNVSAGIKRIQPEGDRSVKVWAEQIAFDDLIRWLDDLQKRAGIATHTINIERQEPTGLINVRMELRSGT